MELRWLDLSFNLIEKIEGLGNLTKLTDLSLFSNRITIIEGLDNLNQLNVLSFGQNLVRQHDDAVQYLKKLKNKLEVLKMSDNPYNYVGQNEQDYTLYTVEVLKGLKYLDYTLIDDQLRKQASAKHGDAMGDLDSQQQENKEEEKCIDCELIEARIETTDRMLQKILDANEEA